MSVRAKLSDLIDALAFDSEFHRTWFDRQSAQIVIVSEEVMGALEQGDAETLNDSPDWQKEEIMVGREVMADEAGDRFIDAPDKFEFHEYRHMEKFVSSLPDETIAEQLWRAIKGKGAFRYFKDALRRLGMEKRWYEYRDNAMKEYVIDWAESNGVAWVDDLKQKPGNQNQ